jgi:hypothetical protein
LPIFDPKKIASHNWEIKKGPKRGSVGSFSETTTVQTPVYIPVKLILYLKKSRVFDF